MGLLIGVGGTKPSFPYDYYYGVEWDLTVSNKRPTRIGKMELHQSLPLQNMMRRCLLNDDGSVNYYLHPNDSTKRDNGASADLSGNDGQYMVELPDTYVRFEQDGNKCRCLMSPHALPGFKLWRKDYVSTVEATVERPTGKLAAVCNKSADYRGGNNNASLDDAANTQLGMPATAISLTNFRAYARKRGSTEWNCNLYATHKKLWWFYVVEYATFDSQDTFNAALTEDGFHQGGLGAGVTTLNGTKWNNFNGYYPVIPCGTTNSLGNKTGVVEYTMPTEYDASGFKVNVPSYRGVENPFGHIWKWTDGAKVLIQSEADGGLSVFYTCDDPTAFTSSGVANYNIRGNLPRKDGYVKAVILGEDGEFMPLEVGAGSTTYFCDYFYTNIPGSGTAERGVLLGGYAGHGASAGFVFANTYNAPSNAYALIGSRLCFYPQIESA